MPEFAIIDAHVHLYDPAVLSYGWMRGDAQLDSKHGLDEFAEASLGVAVDGLVFVEVAADEGLHLQEVRWVESHASGASIVQGIVGALPLERGQKMLGELETFASMPRARGVRRLIQDRPPGWALQPGMIEGVQSLRSFGLPFDICCRHHQLTDIIALVERCPDVTFVLDHMGKPPIRDRSEEPWRSHLRTLAQAPNVFCKISGLATEAHHAAWTYDDLAPFIAHALDCFGFKRSMFGGDWPVSASAVAYAEWIAVLDRLLAGTVDADRRSFYVETARNAYRLA